MGFGDTVASVGPYANNLHLNPDRQPHQHLITQFFTDRMLFLMPKQRHQSTEGINWYTNLWILDFAVIPTNVYKMNTLMNTHTRLTALFPGLPRWAGTRKVKPIWILLKQETVSGSGISWNICKSAPHSRQITTPAPHRSEYIDEYLVHECSPRQVGNRLQLYMQIHITMQTTYNKIS